MADSASRTLIVADDPSLRLLLRTTLEHTVETVEAEDGLDGIRTFHRIRPDLVVVTADAARLDGFEVLRRVREVGDTPVVMISNDPGPEAVVQALRSGADDCVTTPVDPDVFAARVEAVLRRTRSGRVRSDSTIELDQGRLTIDVARAEVWVRGQRVDFSATEYRLLLFLARRADRVASPTEILTHVWGVQYVNEPGYVKSYVRLVRRKIEEDPRAPRYLISRRGLGYCLVSRPAALARDGSHLDPVP